GPERPRLRPESKEKARRTGICEIIAVGGAEGDRTPDLIIANDALSQLSYSPVRRIAAFMVGHRWLSSEQIRHFGPGGPRVAHVRSRRPALAGFPVNG